MLTAVSSHSSVGFFTPQGLNHILFALLWHSDEVVAFELGLRLLNDYHLKEVHMPRQPGLHSHCEVITYLLKD